MRTGVTVRGQWMYPRDAVPASLRSPGPACYLDHFAVTAFDLDQAKTPSPTRPPAAGLSR